MDVASLRFLILIAIVLLPLGGCRKSGSRFTNLKCESYDLDFAKFNNCRLNVLGRGVVGTNIHINLLKIPINNVQINWSLWRRYSGYKLFLYNATCNFCQLLAHPDSISFQSIVLSAIRTSSNLNHSCPYKHDIIVDNMVFKDEFLQKLPLPQGDYKIQMRFATYKVWKFQIEIFLLRNE
ncbi:uncharacterized protein LOC117783796 [Drosophila innubila]|uniref:uncharacterized protein LOC117783796 n=1 Tax=Drosophila innubila TaxID=198719 RepID=UPI00148C9384|nr:uncharacterized protein LOC117783796 [Drosophila innubila]